MRDRNLHGANAPAFAVAFSALALLGACANAERSPSTTESGVSCWDLDSSLTCDASTEDTNGDGECDVLDCRGAAGPQGPAGSDGAPGAMGTQGAQGTPGQQGAQGPQGPQGPSTGVPGPQGPQGPQGPMGPQGMTGGNGAAGAQGIQGPQGTQGVAGTTGQLAATAYGSSSVAVASGSYVAIPGLSQTVTTPANAVIHVSTDGGFSLVSSSATAYATVDFVIAVDGDLLPKGGYRRVTVANTTGVTGMVGTWSTGTTLTLAAGAHTFTVYARWLTGSASTSTLVGGGDDNVHQPTLNIVVLKQ